jgi:hypothetical protein
MSQFATTITSRTRQELDKHSTYSNRDTFIPPTRDNEFGPVSSRNRPSNSYPNPNYHRDVDRYPTSTQWTRPPPSPIRSPSRPMPEIISPRPSNPTLSIRDSINYNRLRHDANGNSLGPKHPIAANRLEDLQAIWRAGRTPLLSPKLRPVYPYPRTPGYRRPYDHKRRGHLPRYPRDPRQYPQGRRLEAGNTSVRLPTEKSAFVSTLSNIHISRLSIFIILNACKHRLASFHNGPATSHFQPRFFRNVGTTFTTFGV